MLKFLQIAFSQLGIKEIRGKEDNPEVVKYFTEIGFERIKNEETAWCSAFINWCAKKANFMTSDALNARSWLTIGKEVLVPRLGDIVVLWRESPDSWKGHVGIFVKMDAKYIYLLGGNQNNSVNITKYPKKKVLGYRDISKSYLDKLIY